MDYHIIAIDPLQSRRDKLKEILKVIENGKLDNRVAVHDIEAGETVVKECTGEIGCNAVLEVSTHGPASHQIAEVSCYRLWAITAP